MKPFVRFASVTVLAACACWCVGQSSPSSTPQESSAKTAKPSPKKAPEPKLDARRRQAVDILQAVESDIGRYSPEMQSYLLLEMADAYKKIDRTKQVAMLKQAFEAAADISNSDARTEQQNIIVHKLDEADPSALLSMQQAPDPKVRATVLRFLVREDIDHNRLQAAVTRLSQWDSNLEYPYQEAERLIPKLGAQQSGERQSVFAAAVAAYRAAGAEPSPEDGLSNLIVKTYELLPPATVADAVDLVLQNAAKNNPDHLSLAVGGKDGQATFDSIYDFQLFKLLPVLDKVDPGKAVALRRDHANIAALNKKYPNGVSSLNPGTANLSMMMSSGDNPTPSAVPDASQRRSADAIVDSAAKDVDSAIAAAQGLSNTADFDFAIMTPRCRVLERIAEQAVNQKNFTGANSALKALLAAAQDLNPLAQGHYFIRAAALSAEMNDPQTAKQDLSRGMKAADALYQKDAFADPPNDAIKANWPSTAVWKGALIVAARIDPAYALQEAASLPDPEIEAVEKVAIAGVMLEEEPGMTSLQVSHNGNVMVEMEFDIPWWHGAAK